jgi:hypothetical protein
MRLHLTTEFVHPGESFGLDASLDNPGPDDLEGVPTFVVLELLGEYYFWPSWRHYDPPGQPEIDYSEESLPVGGRRITIIDPFVWPDTGDQTMDGIKFYGALLDPGLTRVLGEIAVVTWGYGPAR